MGKHEDVEPKVPCMNTTYAYETTIACGRPKDHGPLTRQAADFSFGPNNDCSEYPLPSDGPVYGARKVEAFEVDRNVVRN